VLNQNPYVPPAAALEPEAEVFEIGTGDFSIGRCVSEAWASTWVSFPLWLGVLIVWPVLAIVAFFTILGAFLLVPVLGFGLVQFFVNMHDRRAHFGDIFGGFSRYGAALGAMLALWLVSTLVSVPTTALMQVAVLTQDTTLLYAAWAAHMLILVPINLRLSFALPFIVDRQLGGFDAVGRSWAVTRKLQWKLVGLALTSLLVCLAGVAALGVGVLPASVMAYLMTISAYRQVVGGPRRA